MQLLCKELFEKVVKNCEHTIVSVVVPVYNGERFLEAAVESVIRQTCPDWELLIVDDGSTDGSAAICDRYAASDARIRVWHQPNGGVNSARAKAVDNASGEYLVFLDADDTLPPDALEVSLADVSDGVSVLVTGNDGRILDNEQYMLDLMSGVIGPELWGKMFRASVFKTVDYHLDRRLAMGEDLLINLMVALNSDNIKVITDKIYEANTCNTQSVTRTFKRTWEYEKYYFNQLESRFLSKCTALPCYQDLIFLVNKSKLNGIKYVMLDGNSVDYKDEEFITLSEYFKSRKKCMGLSERLVFILKDSSVYGRILKLYLKYK